MPTSRLMTFVVWAYAEMKILRENDPRLYALRFVVIIFFFPFSLSLSFCWSFWPTIGLAYSSRIAASSRRAIAKCSRGKFFSDFFTQIYTHFCAYFKLNWPNHLTSFPGRSPSQGKGPGNEVANHSDLVIIRKIFSACGVLQILVKGDDVRSGTKAKARHGWLRAAQASVG